MNRSQLVDRCKAIIQEAYDEATEMIVAYLELHPQEQRQTLCKEIDPENWQALDSRIRRRQAARKPSGGANVAPSRAVSDSRIRHARSALREADQDQLEEIVRELPPERRAAVVRAAVPSPQHTERPRRGPSFIELIVRVSSGLIELESMVASWSSLAAVPPEFSRDSFNDVVAKALRIQDRFDELTAAIANEDEDEFTKIVRNFNAVLSDV